MLINGKKKNLTSKALVEVVVYDLKVINVFVFTCCFQVKKLQNKQEKGMASRETNVTDVVRVAAQTSQLGMLQYFIFQYRQFRIAVT